MGRAGGNRRRYHDCPQYRRWLIRSPSSFASDTRVEALQAVEVSDLAVNRDLTPRNRAPQLTELRELGWIPDLFDLFPEV